MFDILSFGSIYLDINCTHFPIEGVTPEKEIVGEAYALQLGGSAVISVAVASSLGLKTAFVGKVGDDLLGQQLKQKLIENRITPHLLQSSTRQTNVSINYINNSGRSLMTTVGSANQSLDAQELIATITPLLDKTKYLYLGGIFKFGHLTDFYRILVREANAQGCTILMDHGRVTNVVSTEQLQLVRDLAKQVAIYIPSIEEAKMVWDAKNADQVLHKVKVHAPRVSVIVTDGPRGAEGIDAQGVHSKTQARDLTPINTVGAGDTFNAGFLYAKTQSMSFADSMQFAQATAEYKIETNTHPTAENIARRLETK